jgi:hypothetical protein
MRRFLFLLISLAGAAQAVPPPKVEITYELSRNGSALATIVENLRHGNGGYELTETWEGRGLFALRGQIRRTSRGNIATDGLHPVEFVDERTGRSTARAHFDWSAMTLTMQFREGPETRPMPPNAQDRLSFMLAFAFLPSNAQPIRFSVADGGSVSTYVFDIVGRERLKTPAGEFDTVRIARRKDGPEDRRSTEIWLASDRGLVPVRVLVTEKDGSQIDQQATRILAP